MIEALISGIMVSIDISDVATASVHSGKTHLKKLMMMKVSLLLLLLFIIMNKPQEMTVLYETQARKVIVDFNFDALYR